MNKHRIEIAGPTNVITKHTTEYIVCTIEENTDVAMAYYADVMTMGQAAQLLIKAFGELYNRESPENQMDIISVLGADFEEGVNIINEKYRSSDPRSARKSGTVINLFS